MVIDQEKTLRLATGLWSRRSIWGGSLVAATGVLAGGSELMVAAHIAGAACLILEEDSAASKAALRSGACDFLVNSLDEALRALKNEIRQKRPVAVVLEAPLSSVLQEMSERGVRPDLAFFEPAARTDFQGLADDSEGLARQHDWRMICWRAATSRELRLADEIAASLLSADDLRSRWLAAAGKFFRRQPRPERCGWWAREELSRFAEQLPAGVSIAS